MCVIQLYMCVHAYGYACLRMPRNQKRSPGILSNLSSSYFPEEGSLIEPGGWLVVGWWLADLSNPLAGSPLSAGVIRVCNYGIIRMCNCGWNFTLVLRASQVLMLAWAVYLASKTTFSL